MSTTETTAKAPPVRRRRAGRLATAVSSGPVAVVLLIIGALWLIPSIGLLATSFRPVEAQETGWWNIFTKPSEFTIQNYVNLIEGVSEPANLLIAAGFAIIGCAAAIGFAWSTLASARTRTVGMIVSLVAGAAVAFELWFLGGAAALIVTLMALPVLGAAARNSLESRTYGRLGVATALTVLGLVISSIPAGSGVLPALRNSVLITIPSSVLLVLIGATAAYAFAWIKFPGRDILFLIVVGLLVVPLQIGLIPIANMYDAVGLFGTIPGVVLFHVAFGLPFAVFLLRNFFIGIPHELLEAARMDGASEWRVFSGVVLPLGIPAIASLLIFQFLWVWNDLLVALVFAGSDSRPLTVAIQQQLRTFGANIDIIAPGAYIQMLVPLIVFFAFQRYFVQGLLAGSQR